MFKKHIFFYLGKVLAHLQPLMFLTVHTFNFLAFCTFNIMLLPEHEAVSAVKKSAVRKDSAQFVIFSWQ